MGSGSVVVKYGSVTISGGLTEGTEGVLTVGITVRT